MSKSLRHQEGGSVHRTVFSLGHFSVPWIFTFWKKKPFLASPGAISQHKAVAFGVYFNWAGLSSQPCSTGRFQS